MSSSFSRYDYEECAGDPCNEMMNRLQDFVDNKDNIGKEFVAAGGKVYKVSKADDFEYTDPIDKSVAKNQVILNLSLLDPHWIAKKGCMIQKFCLVRLLGCWAYLGVLVCFTQPLSSFN